MKFPKKRPEWGHTVPVVVAVLTTSVVLLGGLALLLGKEGLAMAEAMVLVRTQFVGDVVVEDAMDGALDALVLGLGDRWSYYMDDDSYADHQVYKHNATVGIGCTILPQEKGLEITLLVQGGGAETAGLQVGDVITAIDGVAMVGEAQQTASDLIRGDLYSVVDIEVEHEDGTRETFIVKRLLIETSPVTHELLEDGTGYVVVRNFNDRCAQDTKTAVEDLVNQGATALVFDMRNNGGGYVSELTELLDYLLPKGPIFQSETNWGFVTTTQSDAACIDLPMAILVNGGTYSAAELFAAQIRESVGGLVVGSPTFGKGYSQITFPLPTGGAMNLSTAAYRTGGGVSLVGTGVTLDGELEMNETDNSRLYYGQLPHEEDNQLQLALQLLHA